MPSNEFWEKDPRLMSSYIKAYERTQTNKNKIMDINAWSIGAYVYEALLSIEGAKNKKNIAYPSKPRTISEEEKKNEPTVDKVTRQYLMFKAWADDFNKKSKG